MSKLSISKSSEKSGNDSDGSDSIPLEKTKTIYKIIKYEDAPIRLCETTRLRNILDKDLYSCRVCHHRVCVCVWAKLPKMRPSYEEQRPFYWQPKTYRVEYDLRKKEDKISGLVHKKYREAYNKHRQLCIMRQTTGEKTVEWILKPIKCFHESETNIIAAKETKSQASQLNSTQLQRNNNIYDSYESSSSCATLVNDLPVSYTFIRKRKKFLDLVDFSEDLVSQWREDVDILLPTDSRIYVTKLKCAKESNTLNAELMGSEQFGTLQKQNSHFASLTSLNIKSSRIKERDMQNFNRSKNFRRKDVKSSAVSSCEGDETIWNVYRTVTVDSQETFELKSGNELRKLNIYKAGSKKAAEANLSLNLKDKSSSKSTLFEQEAVSDATISTISYPPLITPTEQQTLSDKLNATSEMASSQKKSLKKRNPAKRMPFINRAAKRFVASVTALAKKNNTAQLPLQQTTSETAAEIILDKQTESLAALSTKSKSESFSSISLNSTEIDAEAESDDTETFNEIQSNTLMDVTAAPAVKLKQLNSNSSIETEKMSLGAPNLQSTFIKTEFIGPEVNVKFYEPINFGKSYKDLF